MNYAATMQRYPDEELARIVHHGADEDLDPDAIAAARMELAARGVRDGELRSLMDDAAADQGRAVPHEQRPLGLAARILFVPFGFFLLIPAMIAAVMLGSAGYKRKSQQAWTSIAIAMVILLVTIAAIVIL